MPKSKSCRNPSIKGSSHLIAAGKDWTRLSDRQRYIFATLRYALRHLPRWRSRFRYLTRRTNSDHPLNSHNARRGQTNAHIVRQKVVGFVGVGQQLFRQKDPSTPTRLVDAM